jgi:tetratricopeptide (TPR) repeat protein
MAMGFIKQGLFNKAIEQADRSIALNRGYADAWYLRGYALMELRRFPEALDSFYKAAAVMPPGDDFGLRVWINAGTVLFLMGQLEEALDAYGKAAAIDPQNRMYYRGCRANALYNMAVVYNRLGRNDEARQSLEESLTLRMDEETFTEPVKEFVGPAACDTERIKEGE